MTACLRTHKPWCLAQDVKEHGEAGNVGCAGWAKPQLGSNAMESSKDGGF